MCVLLVQIFTREGLIGGEQSERERAMSYFVPPCNYGMVEYDLSRSGQCHQLNFPFLERLHLKTIIYLSHDEPSQPFLSFLNDQGITLRRPSRADEDSNVITDAHPMSESEVLSALQVVLFTPLCIQNLFHLFTHVEKLHFKKSQKCEEFVAENITLKIVSVKIAGVVDRHRERERERERERDVYTGQLAI
jgi:hypothetical protein